jgi:ankyrin repeat protein
MKSMPSSRLLTGLLTIFILAGCGHGFDHSAAGKNSSGPDAGSPDTVSMTPSQAADQMRQSALDGNLEKVMESLEAGAGVNSVDTEGRTALMFAAFNGHSRIVLELLNRGAGVDRRDLQGRTALLYAATGPFPETVRILLDKGADPNIVDSGEHFTPLMHAAAEGNMEVVVILLQAGADPAAKDIDGDNAETFARRSGYEAVADHLESLR